LSDSYMVWVDIFLQANQIVLVGFSILMRLLIGIIGSILSGGYSSQGAPTSAQRSSNSPFSRWG